MSYESVKLTLAPVAWYRNDELTGTEMSDSSGNAEHQTYVNLDDGVLLGQLSGVDTVVTSRSVYTPGRRVADWLVTAPFDSRVTFSWEVLFKQTGDLLSNRQLVARDNNRLFLSGTTGSITVNFQVRIASTVYTVSSDPTILLDAWYHVIGVRNGASLYLILNGEIVDLRSDLPASTDIDIVGTDHIAYGSTSGGINTLQMLGHLEELTFYNYALSEAQGLEIYESMINSVFLEGRSDVVVSATLSSTFEPDPVSFPFRHNWSEPLIERLSWQSAVSSAKTGAEEAIAQRVKPRRELEFTQLLKSNTERRRFRALLWANQNRKWFIPLRQYVERLLAPLTTGAVLTPITTAWKDYETGSWIGFRQLDDDGSIRHWEERLIVAVNVNSVEHEATENDYAIGAEVYPVKRGYVDASLGLRGHTDAVEETTITVRLLSEDEEAQPNRLTPWTTTITYRDFEVWNPFRWPNNWVEEREWEVQRQVEEVDFGSGVISLESDTDSATEAFSWRVLLNDYEDIAEFLGWFYERRGRWRNLWVTALQEDFAPLSRNGGLTVADTNYSDAYALGEPRRDLAFVYLDNTMTLRRVTGFSGTTNETLELDQSVPTFTNLRLISLLRFCRMDADQIELHWHTNDKVEAVWRFRELTHSPEGTGVTEPSPSASVSPSVSPSISVSLSPSSSASPSASVSPSSSVSPSVSGSTSPSPSASTSLSISPSASVSPSASESLSPSPSASTSPSSSASPSA